MNVRTADGGGPTYGYTAGSPDGPENWGKLSPAYKLCGQGKQQSLYIYVHMHAWTCTDAHII
jgi:carbonic anhydrase